MKFLSLILVVRSHAYIFETYPHTESAHQLVCRWMAQHDVSVYVVIITVVLTNLSAKKKRVFQNQNKKNNAGCFNSIYITSF